MTSRPIQCPHCSKRFRDNNGAYCHVKHKHGGKGKAQFATRHEESMAEVFIEAQINHAIGISNEDWIEDMLP